MQSHLICVFICAIFKERQQFHLEQLRAAEFRARSAAQQQLTREQGPLPPAVGAHPQMAAPTAQVPVQQAGPAVPQLQQQSLNMQPIVAASTTSQ